MKAHADLLILGSGSTAFAAALAAAELGKTAIMTEERLTGGTCVNRGCLPSKNLIEAARLVHDAQRPRFPGLRPCHIQVDFAALVAQKDGLVRDYRRGKYESLVGDTIAIEQGHARFLDAHTVEVGEKRLTGERILIATGSRPAVPDITGLDTVPFLTSDLLTADEPVELRDLPRSLLIIGGGYIALELGQMFARFGTAVTILERSEQILASGYEPELGPAVAEVFAGEDIRIVPRASVQSIRQESGEIAATVAVGGAEREFRAQRLLVATGRRPNSDLIDIERAGVQIGERGQVTVDEHLRTNVGHILAAGDVIGSETGSEMATPVGSRDGRIAALNALTGGPPRPVDHRIIPRVIFTDPQVAVVGLTDEQATAAGRDCWCNSIPMSVVPRAGATRDQRGFIKMVADRRTGEVVGVTMFGHSAGEVIHEAAMAMRFGARVNDFIDLLHAYPTMAEALKIVAISRYKDPARLSCCAE